MMSEEITTSLEGEHSWVGMLGEKPGCGRREGTPVALLLNPNASLRQTNGLIRFEHMLDIGRDPRERGGQSLQLRDDLSVSPEHARIVVQHGQFEISDLGSRNGTIVNSRRISGPTRVSAGSLLFVGAQGLLVDFLTDEQLSDLNLEQENPFLGVPTRCAGLAQSHRGMKHAIQTSAPILLRGSFGTGKSHYVRAIREKAGGCGRMVSIDCRSFSNMGFAESEGWFARMIPWSRPKTTFVFVELQCLPPALQDRILQWASYDEGEACVGHSVLATTSLEPWGSESQSVFSDRAMALFRTFDLPPLSCRRVDIASIAALFVESGLGIVDDVFRMLSCLSWPGNIRQLKRVIRCAEIAALDRGSTVIGVQDLSAEICGIVGVEKGASPKVVRDVPPQLKDQGLSMFPRVDLLQLIVAEFSWLHKLSKREGQVLNLAAEGKSDKEIGGCLNCGYRTVRTYWTRICSKTDTSDRDGVIASLLRWVVALQSTNQIPASDVSSGTVRPLILIT
jgi:DNA-binding CsgD family transcriptional regulator